MVGVGSVEWRAEVKNKIGSKRKKQERIYHLILTINFNYYALDVIIYLPCLCKYLFFCPTFLNILCLWYQNIIFPNNFTKAICTY